MVATATRRTCGVEPRLMGDGRALNFIRCALPTTEFFETPSRRPISDALRPASQSRMSSATRSFVQVRSEEHTSELQSLMRISYAVFCLKKKKIHQKIIISHKYYLQ